MSETPSVADRLMDTALELAAAQGWRSLAMGAIAREAGISLAETLACFRSKAHLATALLMRADHRMLQGAETSADEPVRDRLFEVIMRRFDILQPHKAAVTAIVRDLPRDPLLTLPILPQFLLSMQWILEAAGVGTAGPLGLLRVQGLAMIYLSTLRVWMSDDSQDLARTMAALDKALMRADMLIRRLPILGTTKSQSPAPASGGELDRPNKGV